MTNVFNVTLNDITTTDQLYSAIVIDRRRFPFTRDLFCKAMGLLDARLGKELEDCLTYTVYGNAMPCNADNYKLTNNAKQTGNSFAAFSFAVQPAGSDKVWIFTIASQRYYVEYQYLPKQEPAAQPFKGMDMINLPQVKQELPVFSGHQEALCSLVCAIVNDLLVPNSDSEHGYRDFSEKVLAPPLAMEAPQVVKSVEPKISILDADINKAYKYVKEVLIDDKFLVITKDALHHLSDKSFRVRGNTWSEGFHRREIDNVYDFISTFIDDFTASIKVIVDVLKTDKNDFQKIEYFIFLKDTLIRRRKEIRGVMFYDARTELKEITTVYSDVKEDLFQLLAAVDKRRGYPYYFDNKKEGVLPDHYLRLLKCRYSERLGNNAIDNDMYELRRQGQLSYSGPFYYRQEEMIEFIEEQLRKIKEYHGIEKMPATEMALAEAKTAVKAFGGALLAEGNYVKAADRPPIIELFKVSAYKLNTLVNSIGDDIAYS